MATSQPCHALLAEAYTPGLTAGRQLLDALLEPAAAGVLGVVVKEGRVLVHGLAAIDVHRQPAVRAVAHVLLAGLGAPEPLGAVQALRPADDLGHAEADQAAEVKEVLLIGNDETVKDTGTRHMPARREGQKSNRAEVSEPC